MRASQPSGESLKDKIFMYLKVKKSSHALLCELALMLDVIVSQLGEAAAPGMGWQASSDGPHSMASWSS